MEAVASSNRGLATVQPAYFTSSLFVEPLMHDIDLLLAAFAALYAQNQSQPFIIFKKCWNEQGWKWLHFRIFDGRGRQALLNTTFRLLLEKVLNSEDPVHKVSALFSLYALYFTQPNSKAPKLHYVSYITVPYDSHLRLRDFPKTLTTPYLSPLRGPAIFALSCFLKRDIFHLLPPSHTHSIYPRRLPRVIVRKLSITNTPPETKKQGRPSKQDRYRRAKDALAQLNIWTGHVSPASSANAGEASLRTVTERPTASLDQYVSQKLQLLEKIGFPTMPMAPEFLTQQQRALVYANETSLRMLEDIERQAALQGKEIGNDGSESRTGLERVQRAASEFGSSRNTAGVLGLTEGGGLETV